MRVTTSLKNSLLRQIHISKAVELEIQSLFQTFILNHHHLIPKWLSYCKNGVKTLKTPFEYVARRSSIVSILASAVLLAICLNHIPFIDKEY